MFEDCTSTKYRGGGHIKIGSGKEGGRVPLWRILNRDGSTGCMKIFAARDGYSIYPPFLFASPLFEYICMYIYEINSLPDMNNNFIQTIIF